MRFNTFAIGAAALMTCGDVTMQPVQGASLMSQHDSAIHNDFPVDEYMLGQLDGEETDKSGFGYKLTHMFKDSKAEKLLKASAALDLTLAEEMMFWETRRKENLYGNVHKYCENREKMSKEAFKSEEKVMSKIQSLREALDKYGKDDKTESIERYQEVLTKRELEKLVGGSDKYHVGIGKAMELIKKRIEEDKEDLQKNDTKDDKMRHAKVHEMITATNYFTGEYRDSKIKEDRYAALETIFTVKVSDSCEREGKDEQTTAQKAGEIAKDGAILAAKGVGWTIYGVGYVIGGLVTSPMWLVASMGSS